MSIVLNDHGGGTACDECRDAEEIPCEEGCMGEDPDCDRCNGNGVVPCPSCQED